ncbi:MAG: hypothetical protein ACYTFM_06075 [Planctomycetota bacterium]|jgi:hypothetical protein
MKLAKSYRILLFVGVGLLLLFSLVVLTVLERGEHIHTIRYQTIVLKITESAIRVYYLDNGILPSEDMYRESLKTYLEDKTILSQIRYFCESDNFVLVSSGNNKKFETPKGYQKIKIFNGETDDIIRFSQVRKASD